MNIRERKRILTLERRRDYLAKRIADYQGKDVSRDKAEHSALSWILEQRVQFQNLKTLYAEVSNKYFNEVKP